ncbi:MAG: hypothetical protein ACTSRG_25735, partial [Candidatus Helarchaeota archaeon]
MIFIPIGVLILLDLITSYFFYKSYYLFRNLLVSYCAGICGTTITFQESYHNAIKNGKYDWKILKNLEREKAIVAAVMALIEAIVKAALLAFIWAMFALIISGLSLTMRSMALFF